MKKILLLLVLLSTAMFAQRKLILQQQDIINVDDKLNNKLLSGKIVEELSVKTYALHNKTALQKSNIVVENAEKMCVAVYFENYPSASELTELDKHGVKYLRGTWTPPLDGHPLGFMLAEIPVDSFLTAINLPYIKKVGYSGSINMANNNNAAKKIKADSAWAAGWTGKGVKVAILDSGLDTEPANSDLPSTIQKRDYSNYPASIDNNVENTVSSHGTHVTGSVLGRGVLSQANTGNSGGSFKGEAPDADLVFLKIGLDEDGGATGDALIAAMHAAVDTFHAAILSMSYGGWYEHHDGTNPIEQAVDWVYSSGKPFFISAGNDGDAGRHYSGTVDANSSTDFIQVNVDKTPADKTKLFFNLVWSDGAERKNLTLQYYNANKVLLASISYAPTESPRGTESRYSGIEKFLPASSSVQVYYLKVVNPSSTPQKFHIYEDWGNDLVTFNNPDPYYTIGQPATADHAFAVGAFVSRIAWKASNGYSYNFDPQPKIDRIASFSSQGPRVDEVTEPSITAPGTAIISMGDRDVAAEDALIIDNDGTLGSGDANYAIMQGTSMATPIAAGAAALILQKYPSAAPSDIYTAIKNAALTDGYTGTVPNNTWGYGKLNIYNAINYMSSVPVELVSFSGYNNRTSVKLSWETATETNNNGFEIERSAGSSGGPWIKTGFIQGHGTTTASSSYSFTDNNIVSVPRVYYRLKQVDFDGSYKYSNTIEITMLPSKYALEQNFPNPFNPVTTINFSLPEDSKVKISVYNVMGEKVAEPYNNTAAAGYNQVTFNASGMASGVYYYRIEAAATGSKSEFSAVKKMVLLK
jgi:subtilisin family serine protease